MDEKLLAELREVADAINNDYRDNLVITIVESYSRIRVAQIHADIAGKVAAALGGQNLT